MIKENLKNILENIRIVEKNSNRITGSVRLCAVSKFHPAESVQEAFEQGQIVFGENRVQEAAQKFDSLRDKGITPELHIIGSLQRNKVKEAVRIACCIQSVDRIELMDEIEKQCSKIDKKIQVLFEVHTGEDSKAGFETYEALSKAVELCSQGKYPHLEPKGLMTMAPNTADQALIRKSFSSLRNMLDQLNESFPRLKLAELSMGMSGDYKIAIEEGSTMVRVGTAIFGERDYSK